MTRWLAAHPYLQPVADVHALVEAAAAEVFVPVAPIPNWEDTRMTFAQACHCCKARTLRLISADWKLPFSP